MNSRDAQAITRMVESGWSCDFGPQGRDLWCQMLESFDAELATQAVVEMSRFPLPGGRFKPQVSDLRSIIISLRARNEKTQHELVAGKWGTATPEWVWLWSYARYIRVPPDTRAFPQQDGFCDPQGMMTKDEYEKLRAEWVQEGSPKRSHPLPSALL